MNDDEDELTFLRGIQTSRGRMVRVVRPQGEHCILQAVQAVLLPYQTCKTTDKDIFLAHTHYTN